MKDSGYEWQPLAPRGQSDWCFQLSGVLSQDLRQSVGSSAVLVGFCGGPPTACSNQSTTQPHSRLSQVGSLMTRSPDMRDRKKLFLHRCSQPNIFITTSKYAQTLAFLSPAELFRPSFSREVEQKSLSIPGTGNRDAEGLSRV